MGSAPPVGSSEERPQHNVTVNAFEMDVTEVTVRAYDACVRAGVCRSGTTGGWCNEDRRGRAEHPINCVDWDQARTYCEWVGKRLPTEEEWEYAAVGTDGRTYPWGNDAPVRQLCWKQSYGTCAVGSFAAGDSPFGLHDMAGNVWEWTASGISEDYSKPRDPSRPVYRGGSWDIGVPVDVRSAFREADPKTTSAGMLGFRCAR
jgi:formylglycine-generating enzyme required for sulfatase activity